MSNLSKIFAFLFVKVVLAKTHFCYSSTNIEETMHIAMGGHGLFWTLYTEMNKAMSIIAKQNEEVIFVLTWKKGSKPEVTFSNPTGMDLIFKLNEKAGKAFAGGLKAVHHLDGFVFTKPSWKGGDICLHSGSYWKPEGYDRNDEWSDDFATMGEAICRMDAHYSEY